MGETRGDIFEITNNNISNQYLKFITKRSNDSHGIPTAIDIEYRNETEHGYRQQLNVLCRNGTLRKRNRNKSKSKHTQFQTRKTQMRLRLIQEKRKERKKIVMETTTGRPKHFQSMRIRF